MRAIELKLMTQIDTWALHFISLSSFFMRSSQPVGVHLLISLASTLMFQQKWHVRGSS